MYGYIVLYELCVIVATLFILYYAIVSNHTIRIFFFLLYRVLSYYIIFIIKRTIISSPGFEQKRALKKQQVPGN